MAVPTRARRLHPDRAAGRPRAGARSGSWQRASLYWSKAGDWYEVQVGAEAGRFCRGVPSGAARLRLISGPGGGFVKPASGLRSLEDHLDLDAVLVCCHGGPGEDGTLQAALDLTGVPYSGPTAMGAALGMDKLAFGAS